LREHVIVAREVTGASRTLYRSGQVGVAANGSVPENAEGRYVLAWRNRRARLPAAGMEIENLVKNHHGARRLSGTGGRTHIATGKDANRRRPNPARQIEVEGIGVA
jgi:2-iminobutanoate/2-iminopropanoate deaminase